MGLNQHGSGEEISPALKLERDTGKWKRRSEAFKSEKTMCKIQEVRGLGHAERKGPYLSDGSREYGASEGAERNKDIQVG